MHLNKTITVLTLSAALSGGMAMTGCDGVHENEGDFAAFFAVEARGYGIHFSRVSKLNVLPASWTLQSDANGFQMHVRGASFEELSSLMESGFGKPLVFEKTNLSGFPQKVWGGAPVGGGVQCIGSRAGADILVVKSMSAWKLPPSRQLSP